MSQHAHTQQRLYAASLLPPRPFTPAELHSELLSIERHLRALLQQRRTLKRQLNSRP